MLTNQKFILFLSLIILSFSAEPEEEDFDKRIEEEPQLIGITKGIVEKTKQTVGLIFQNSKLDPRGFQSLYLRQKKNNAFFIIPLKCKEKMPYAKNIMGVFCDIDLKREKILPGVYKVENVKYKYKYFLDEVTHLEIFKGHQPELIGVREIMESDSHIWIFFNNLEDVVPNLVKAIKFTDGEKEYEFNLSFCQKNYECVFCSCYDSDCFKDLKVNKYEVKHITYNNEIMKPNDRIYFYYATKEVFVYYFPKSIPKKKNLDIELDLTKFDESDGPIDFYFQEINHSYIIYKIRPYPKGDWIIHKHSDSYDDYYTYSRHFVFDTENIPRGKYKVEWVFQNIKKGNITTEVKDE